MCGITQVTGAAGPPGKVAQSGVAGASGAPTKVAGQSGDAAAGAKAIQGGGGSALSAALEGVAKAVEALKDAISKLQVSGGGRSGCGHHGKVAGVQGQAATKAQFVAKQQNFVSVNTNNVGADREDDAFEQRVMDLVNQERAKAGLAPVSYNAIVDNAAEKHAVHMSKVGRMAHDGIGDGDPGERIRAEGWRKAWGENVATGQTSPEQVVREWMNSPTHRSNILDPNFRVMGVGQVVAENGRTYWAQSFGA